MPATFESVWRKVALQASSVPPLLARSYTQDAYQEACQGRRWSFLRRQTQLVTRASRTVQVVAAVNSADITGAPATFTASDLYRQIRTTNQGVPYTIVALDATFATATLDQLYTGASGTTDFTILDAFLFMPEGFDGVKTLSNLTVQQPMPWWYTKEQLDFWDPNRIWSDTTARIIASVGVWQIGALAGRQYYEWWPYPTALAQYQMFYYAVNELADTDLLQGQLATRSHVLETGALAMCARYPGTPERKNPYFNTALAGALEKKFAEGLQELEVRDEDTSPMEEFNRIDWRWVQGLVPMDTHLLRSTDATLSDYFGGGYSSGAYNY